MHRDTSRTVDQCSDKLQRGTCAKNTVHFLKNDPNLTCPQCTIRIVQYTAFIPSEDISCDTEGHLLTADPDNNDLETTWAQDDTIQSVCKAQLPPTLSVPFCSRPVSIQFDPQLPGHLQLDNYDLEELSHEDGIQLIDEMYGDEYLGSSVEDMDISDEEILYVPAESQYDLEQAHNMTNKINEIMQSEQRSAISDGSHQLPPMHWATLVDLNDSKEVEIEANMIEARELLRRAQQELENLRHTRQEVGSDFLWCLERYTTLTQISVESGL